MSDNPEQPGPSVAGKRPAEPNPPDQQPKSKIQRVLTQRTQSDTLEKPISKTMDGYLAKMSATSTGPHPLLPLTLRPMEF